VVSQLFGTGLPLLHGTCSQAPPGNSITAIAPLYADVQPVYP
jgi:hypothetical protein